MCASADLRSVAENIIEYLRSKHHPEKPHISVIAPPPQYIYSKLWSYCRDFERRQHVVEEEEVDIGDSSAEEVEELIKSKIPPSIFGADFEVSGNLGVVVGNFKFFIRREFDSDSSQSIRPEAYTNVTINFIYEDNKKVEVMIQTKDIKNNVKNNIKDNQLIAYVIGPGIAYNNINEDELKKWIELIASRGVTIRPEVIIHKVPIPPPWDQLFRGVVHDKNNGQKNGYYHYLFALLIGKIEQKFKIYLVNLGGYLESNDKDSIRSICKKPYAVHTWNQNPNETSRWVLGHLFEVEGQIDFTDYESKTKKRIVDWREYGLTGAWPANSLIIEGEKPGLYYLKDYFIGEEVLMDIEKGGSVDLLKAIILEHTKDGCEKYKQFIEYIIKVLKEYLNISFLYKFQEESVSKILKLAMNDSEGAIVITARTAAGKTLAFMLPIIAYIAYEKLCRNAPDGVKALLMYPTKALANDQLEELAYVLYYLDKVTRNNGVGLKITFGILHGNVKSAEDLEDEYVLPLTCPEHGGAQLKLACSDRACETKCQKSPACEFADFLNRTFRKTRNEIYHQPPDILIADEDIINRIISGYITRGREGRERIIQYEWQIFGYSYKYCNDCKFTYPFNYNIRKCKNCGSSNIIQIANLSKPRIVVLDEAHTLYGSFGIQVSYLLSQMEKVLENDKKPIYVLSSATMSKPVEFAATLLNLDKAKIEHISPRVIGSSQRSKRIFVFIMPKSYTREATAVRTLYKLYNDYEKAFSKKPRGIVFTNTLPESNELVWHLRNAFGRQVAVNGHTTDYEGDRQRIENDFKQGKLDLLVATATLEVGIDYGTVDYVVIHGMPYKLTSFIQRIGRAGRKRDAIVFTIFDPESPINYYYYENYKILYDSKLRDGALGLEVNVISHRNEEALRRAVRRWAASVVNQLCSSNKKLDCGKGPIKEGLACKALYELDNNERECFWKEVLMNILKNREYMSDLLQRLLSEWPLAEKILNDEVENIINILSNNVKMLKSYKDFIEKININNSLHNLRGSDKDVVIEYINLFDQDQTLKRRRELRYVVRNMVPGMFTSYRGLHFVIKEVISLQSQPIDSWIA